MRTVLMLQDMYGYAKKAARKFLKNQKRLRKNIKKTRREINNHEKYGNQYPWIKEGC